MGFESNLGQPGNTSTADASARFSESLWVPPSSTKSTSSDATTASTDTRRPVVQEPGALIAEKPPSAQKPDAAESDKTEGAKKESSSDVLDIPPLNGNFSKAGDPPRFSEQTSVPPPSAADLAAMKKPPIFTGSDIPPLNLERLASPAGDKHPTMATIADLARKSVGSSALGNKAPSEAKVLPDYKVPPQVKCAATVSTWLVDAGFIGNEDFKVRVTDPKQQGLSELLPELGFNPVQITGKIDPDAYPDGPVGIIAGTEKFKDGTNHVGFVEKRNGELRVMHNRSGTVHDDSLIGSYFYGDNGNPRFGKMKLFVLGGTKS